MQSLAARVASFNPPSPPKSSRKRRTQTPKLSWPHPLTFRANPQSLAEAGFFHQPSEEDPDNVICYMCDKELSQWEPEDEPRSIHIEKCPDCPWVMVMCKLVDERGANGRFVFSDDARVPTSTALESARLETFGRGKGRWWPHDMVRGHGAMSKQMAKAGFTYTPAKGDPEDDTATCLYCDTVLGGWEFEDDPLAEHMRRANAAACPFIQSQSSKSVTVEPAQKGSKKAKGKAKAVVTADSDAEQSALTVGQKSKRGKNVTAAPDRSDVEAELPVEVHPPPAPTNNVKRSRKTTVSAQKDTVSAVQVEQSDTDIHADPQPHELPPIKSKRSKKSVAHPISGPSDLGTALESEVDAGPAKSKRTKKVKGKAAASDSAEVEDSDAHLPPPTKSTRSRKTAAWPEQGQREEPRNEGDRFENPPAQPKRSRRTNAAERNGEDSATEVSNMLEQPTQPAVHSAKKKQIRKTQVAVVPSDAETEASVPLAKNKRGRKTVAAPIPVEQATNKAPAHRRGQGSGKENMVPNDTGSASELDATDAATERAAKLDHNSATTTGKKSTRRNPTQKKLDLLGDTLVDLNFDEDKSAKRLTRRGQSGTTTTSETSTAQSSTSRRSKRKGKASPPVNDTSDAATSEFGDVDVMDIDATPKPLPVAKSLRGRLDKPTETDPDQLAKDDSQRQEPRSKAVYKQRGIVEVVIAPSHAGYKIGPPKSAKKLRSKSRQRVPVSDLDPAARLEVERAVDEPLGANIPAPPEEVAEPSERPLLVQRAQSTSLTSKTPSPVLPLEEESLDQIFSGITLQRPLVNGRKIDVVELTEAEKSMTVEEWIRREIERQYDLLKRDGEREIERMKDRSREIRARIEAL